MVILKLLLILLTIVISSCSWSSNEILYKKNDMFYKAENENRNNKIETLSKKKLYAAIGHLPFEEKKALNKDMPDDHNALFYSAYSKKMGVKFNGNENKELLTAIDNWMGTPYRWGGCSKYGIDCSCLIKNIYQDVFDISLNRISFMIFADNVIPIDKKNLTTGDLLAFEMDESGISHVGLYIKDNKFVHASLSKGVIISSLNSKYYKNRFVAGGRVIQSQHIKIAELHVKDLPES
ncbi:Endopeptidase NLPC/P60 domain-containing protein [Desulfonema limicola]|uniref:Endopeptidase NLPC/P60 domain-containing protein n=1 Tax=Desulfonema limicola TaxID=45656 RepID=A0A975B878_9BACT|nr:NlpC/P60 family protein [Desulfonema limicola]QTA80390.1 Endopeptidase NLPC/P60 domain-containing protein [Desulfonema limicola]